MAIDIFSIAKSSIYHVFGDTSVSRGVTRDRMEELKKLISEYLEAL